MYVNIRARLFKEDPAKRFATRFKCSPEVWRKLWHRYKILEYTKSEAREYLSIILKIPIDSERFDRWVQRTEIYLRAQIALDEGCKQVNSEFFGKHKDFVEKEITKNK